MDRWEQHADSLVGKMVPEVTFRGRRDGAPQDRSSAQVFGGRRVVVFALPGAFTPTCSTSHLPRYNQLAPIMKQHGVDEVVCISVNDGFVMDAWARDQRADNITFLADGNGSFTAGLGFLVDKDELGFGKRSWRYSMLVDNGIIQRVFAEPDKPGDPFEVSDADTMLRYLAPDAKEPPAVTIFTKPGCAFCARAKQLLSDKGYGYEEIVLGGQISYSSLWNVTGRRVAPQIYIDGKHIDGLQALQAELE